MDLALRRALEAVRHACDPTPPWHDILDASRGVVGGDSATFILFEDRQLLAAEHVGVDDAAIRDYVQHFHPHDILLRAGPPRPAGTWLDTRRILQRERSEGSRHYHAEFMCLHRMRQMVCLVVEEDERCSAAITVHRSDVRDDAQARAQSESIAAYGRAVREAFAARRLQAARMLGGSALALDDFGHAGCLVSGRGRVLWASPAAQALFEQSSLQLRQGRWWHADARVRAALAGGLLRSTLSGEGARPPLRVVVPEGGAGCLVLEMVPADPQLRWAREAAVFVRMQAPRPVQRAPVDALCMAFRISPAEARVLAALVNGETLADHARAHGVSIHTVRKQIANLREKMGCTRQVDMVRLALAVV